MFSAKVLMSSIHLASLLLLAACNGCPGWTGPVPPPTPTCPAGIACLSFTLHYNIRGQGGGPGTYTVTQVEFHGRGGDSMGGGSGSFSLTGNSDGHYGGQPYMARQFASDLDSGPWNLGVRANGVPYECPGPIVLMPGRATTVTLRVDQGASGYVTSCTGS